MDIIKPKVVFTFIDNSFKFSEFALLRKNKHKFIALQNGARYEHKILKILYDKKIINKKKNFFIPNYLCFGTNEIEDYKKHDQNIKKFTRVGSLKLSNFLSSQNKSFFANSLDVEPSFLALESI